MTEGAPGDPARQAAEGTAARSDAGVPCQECGGQGVRYDRRIEVGRFGQLEICQCIVRHCRCAGLAPYLYWDEESQRRWCPCATA